MKHDELAKYFRPKYIEVGIKEWDQEVFGKKGDAVKILSEYFIEYGRTQIEIEGPENYAEEEMHYIGLKGSGIDCDKIVSIFSRSEEIIEFEYLKIGSWLGQDGISRLYRGYHDLLTGKEDRFEFIINKKESDEVNMIILKFGVLDDKWLVLSAEDYKVGTSGYLSSKFLIGKTQFPENKISSLVRDYMK